MGYNVFRSSITKYRRLTTTMTFRLFFILNAVFLDAIMKID